MIGDALVADRVKMHKIVRWLLVACSVVMSLSALTFAIQGGFGAGHGDFYLLIYLAGMPWTAITWPPVVMQSDVIWLIVWPYSLDLMMLAAIAMIVRLVNGGQRPPTAR